jgi:hypothetical protein
MSTGRGGYRGHGNGRGGRAAPEGAAPTAPPKPTGACAELGIHIFDFGPPEAAEQMTTTWEGMEVFVGKEYNEDIRNELRTGREVMIPEPQLPASVALVHQAKTAASKVRIQRLLDAKKLAEKAVTLDLAGATDNLLKAELAVKLAGIHNGMDALQAQFDNPPGPHLKGDDKAKNDGAWRAYNVRVSKLEEYRGNTCALILGQCTQVLKDKLKHDPDYKTVIDSGKPLQYKSLIEKTIMAQAEDQFNCASVHDQMCHLLGFSQGTLSNDQYYERFNTRVDVSKTVGVNRVQDGITKPLAKCKCNSLIY